MKKKLISVLLVLVMVACVFPTYAFAANDEQSGVSLAAIAPGSSGYIHAMAVSFRNNAGTNSLVKSYLFKPDTFTVLGTATASNMNWYYARMTGGGSFGQVGYFASQFATSGSTSQRWYVDVNVANFREAPGMSSYIMGKVERGDTFMITDNKYIDNDQWFKVIMTSGSFSGYEGYLSESVVDYG